MATRKSIHQSFLKKLYVRLDDSITLPLRRAIFDTTLDGSYGAGFSNGIALPMTTSTYGALNGTAPGFLHYYISGSYRKSWPGFNQDISNCYYYGSYTTTTTDSGCNHQNNGSVWTDTNGQWWYVR